MEKKRNQVSFVEAGEEKWPASVLGGTTASLRSLDDLPSPGKFDNGSNVSYAASLEFHGSSDGEEKEGESDEAPTPRPVPLNFVDRDEFINDNKFFNPKGLDLSRRPPRGDPDGPMEHCHARGPPVGGVQPVKPTRSGLAAKDEGEPPWNHNS